MLRRRARHRHPDRARLAALGLLVALAGCGGGEEEPVSVPAVEEPPTKAEFIGEADRICLSGNAQIEAAADDLVAAEREPPPAEVRQIVLGFVVPALETQVRAIRSIGAPSGDEGEVEAILAATERGIAQLEADPAGVLDATPPALRQAGRLARRFGSQQCGIR